MGIAEAYPAPIHGVSTLAPRNRLEGQAGLQTNFRSDPVQKLTRRPAMQWVERLLEGQVGGDLFDNLRSHKYTRDGKNYRLLLHVEDNELVVFVDNVLEGTFEAPTYVGPNMVMQTVENTTYFLNTDVTVLIKDTIDDVDDPAKRIVSRVTHINVISALNYGETVTVQIKRPDDRFVRLTVSYTVPEVTGTDYSVADTARATSAVAQGIVDEINSEDRGTIQAFALGSTIALYEYEEPANSFVLVSPLHVSVAAGQGAKSVTVVNATVESIEGLPKYAVVGTRIKVQPNPTSNKGTYYLNATSVATGVSEWELNEIPSDFRMTEVVWSESRSPIEEFELDSTTLPFTYSIQDGIQTVVYRDRKVGDNDSVKVPDFVNNTIANLAYFQKRLVFLSENNAIMSETDDLENFWRQSAVQLLVTDPVSVASSAAGADKLLFAVPHNKDLLLTTSNSQFKIDGSVAITPQTVAMPLTTSYQSQIGVPPVSMGNAVILPLDYGKSSGVQAYSGEKETQQDVAESLTDHIIGYMPGSIRLMVSNPNLEMLAIVTDTGGSNKLFIYEQFTNRGKLLQQAWSEWILPESTQILDMDFTGDKLSLVVIEQRTQRQVAVLKELRLYSRVSTGENEIYLDDMVRLETDGNTAALPDDYDVRDIVVVRGEGTNYEFNLARFHTEGRVIHFEENVGVGIVYAGRLYKSRYVPTRPFKYDKEGIVDTLDRIRVNKYKLSVVKTNRISQHIISDYTNSEDQTFTGRIAGQLGSKLGEVPFHTGDIKFAYSQQADQADVEFYCDNHLGCTIAGISWEGQHHKTRSKMR